MKKVILCAILAGGLAACYTPLNNSGVATTKSWLEVAAKKTDFDGKQYDSCYRFNVRFWPPEAAEQLDLKEACISACCWRSDTEEITLDFNKNFAENLAYYGRARKYSPGKITFKINHANWINTTKVMVSPKGIVSNDGLIKLTYEEVENPTRLQQIETASRRLQARRNAYLIEQQQGQLAEEQATASAAKATRKKAKKNTKKQTQKHLPYPIKETALSDEEKAKQVLLHQAGTKIDQYFYRMDKAYKKQGAFFLLSDRILHLRSEGNEFVVTCQARARTGLDLKNLKASTFSCGNWRVNPAQNTVLPADARARLIWEE